MDCADCYGDFEEGAEYGVGFESYDWCVLLVVGVLRLWELMDFLVAFSLW